MHQVVLCPLHNQWKINIVKDIFSHGLELIEEVDTSLLNVPQRNALLAVQTDVTHLLRVFPNTRPASQAATLASKHSSRDPKGPLIKEPIPCPSTVPNPPSGTSTKKKRKTYICEMCGVEKSKQQDLIDHKRNVHNEGTENTPFCDTCKKSFGNKSSLTLHVKSIHQRIFIHNCTICDYKTNSKQQFQSHIKGYGSKEEQKLQKTHKCPNCEKDFFTNALLKKHLNADTCQIAKKNFECDHCRPSRWFISNPSLVRHIKVYYTHEIQ